MKKYYIFRHGTQKDYGITEESKNEAIEIGKKILKDNGITKDIDKKILLVTSSSQRAVETAIGIDKGLNNIGYNENKALTLYDEPALDDYEKNRGELLLEFLKQFPGYLIYIFVTHQPIAHEIASGLGYKGKRKGLDNLEYYEFNSNKNQGEIEEIEEIKKEIGIFQKITKFFDGYFLK